MNEQQALIVMTPEHFDGIAKSAFDALVDDEHVGTGRGWRIGRRTLEACGPPRGRGATHEADGAESVAAFRERMLVHAEKCNLAHLVPDRTNLSRMRAAAALIPEDEERGLAWTTAYKLSTRGLDSTEAVEVVQAARARHPAGLVPASALDPIWTDYEWQAREQLEAGLAVVVNLRDHEALVAWATERNLLVRIDRGTAWGNHFVVDEDGDRATVIAAYRDHYLPHKPSLMKRINELVGMTLACWCAPEPCHGDVLVELATQLPCEDA